MQLGSSYKAVLLGHIGALTSDVHPVHAMSQCGAVLASITISFQTALTNTQAAEWTCSDAAPMVMDSNTCVLSPCMEQFAYTPVYCSRSCAKRV